MKTLIFSTFLMILVSQCLVGQTPRPNACVVSYSVMTKKQSDADAEPKVVELGSIDISGVTEGTLLKRSYKIGETGLYAFVELLFDDDMQYGPVPTDALTVDVIINRGKTRLSTSVIGASSTQLAFDDFKRAIVMASARQGPTGIIVMADCQDDKAEKR